MSVTAPGPRAPGCIDLRAATTVPTVTLTWSGLPTGVTASFNPASTGSTSTLTLAVGVNAKKGTRTITVTGVTGALSDSIPVQLQIR